MKKYIDKLKEIETLVELSIGTTMKEETATDIYTLTNDLISEIKKLNIPDEDVSGRFYSDREIEILKEECYQDGLDDGQWNNDH